MKLKCLVKFVPDSKKNNSGNNKSKMIINPDDSTALEYALRLKNSNKNIHLEVITMGPLTLQKKIEDIARLGVDKVTLISDKKYVGSDTLVTSKIISRYISGLKYDVILSGTNSIDGDTGHVGPQVAQLLGINQMSSIDEIESVTNDNVEINIENGNDELSFRIETPCLLSVLKNKKYRLRFVKYDDLELDVSDKVSIIGNDILKFSKSEVGLEGSPTRVKWSRRNSNGKIVSQIFTNDDSDIDSIYNFLKSAGVV